MDIKKIFSFNCNEIKLIKFAYIMRHNLFSNFFYEVVIPNYTDTFTALSIMLSTPKNILQSAMNGRLLEYNIVSDETLRLNKHFEQLFFKI